MIKVIDIIKRNNDTFYNYRTKNRYSIRPRILLFSLVALSLTAVGATVSNDLANAVIATLSIVLGFSFTALFYLASLPALTIAKEISTEKRIKTERNEQLGRELFSNLSYFNLISISTISTCIFLIFINDNYNSMAIIRRLSPIFDFYACAAISSIIGIHIAILKSTMFCMLFETIYSFIRIVKRITFYSESKRALGI